MEVELDCEDGYGGSERMPWGLVGWSKLLQKWQPPSSV